MDRKDMIGGDLDFEFEQAINRQEDDRKRLLESQGLLRDQHGRNLIVGRSRSIVCRHWLRGMCWKGELCEFLHQYDTNRMPICRQYQKTGHCSEHDGGNCVFLHEKLDDGPPCVHYYLGFCRAGPKCRQRHQRLDKENLPPLVPDWYLRLVLKNAWSAVPQEIDPETEGIMEHVEAVCRELAGSGAGANPSRGGRGTTTKLDSSRPIGMMQTENGIVNNEMQHNDLERPVAGQQLRNFTIDKDLLLKAEREGIPRLPRLSALVPKIRVFMIKSSELKNIHKSIRLGVWATGKQNTRLLEQAFTENDHVVLLFSANESGGFQGYGRMASLPLPGLHTNLWGAFSVRLGHNFRVQWLKQCRLEFEKLGGLVNPLNDNQPIRKSRDCQEVPLPLAQVICTVLDGAPDENLLVGTEEGSIDKPLIDHSNFFELSEEQKIRIENSLGMVSGSSLSLPSQSVSTNYGKIHRDSQSRLSNVRNAPYSSITRESM